MSKILIVEDDRDINGLLTETLNQAGFETASAFDGLNGLKLAQSGDFCLIMMDIMLPYISGDEILKKIREKSDVPIIVISAKDMVSTKIDMLKMGADDYITKPFDLGEVTARVETALRHSGYMPAKGRVIRYKDIVLDSTNKIIKVGDNEIKCTAKEFMILEMLMQNPEKVFTKANIFESVWREDYMCDDNVVKTHISNLRSKLEKANPNEAYIETVWGLGYRLYKLV